MVTAWHMSRQTKNIVTLPFVALTSFKCSKYLDNKLLPKLSFVFKKKIFERIFTGFFIIPLYFVEKKSKEWQLSMKKWKVNECELIFTFLYKWKYRCCMLRVEGKGVLVNIFITNTGSKDPSMVAYKRGSLTKKLVKCYWSEMLLKKGLLIVIFLFYVSRHHSKHMYHSNKLCI